MKKYIRRALLVSLVGAVLSGYTSCSFGSSDQREGEVCLTFVILRFLLPAQSCFEDLEKQKAGIATSSNPVTELECAGKLLFALHAFEDTCNDTK